MSSPADMPAPEEPGAQSQAWSSLLERLLRGLEQGSRQWPIGRRKDSVSRMLVMYRQDMHRLRQRLEPLVASWEGDRGASGAPLPGAGQQAATRGAAAEPDPAPMQERPAVAEAPPAGARSAVRRGWTGESPTAVPSGSWAG